MKIVYILIVTFILSGCASKKIENNENIKYKHLIISEKRDPGGYWVINSPVFMSNNHKKVFTEENNTDFYTAFYNTYNNSFTTSNITSCNIVEYFDSGTKNNKNICSMKKIKKIHMYKVLIFQKNIKVL